MLEGSCCCGRIAFELTESPKMMGSCHCSRCRKTGMTPFVIVARSSFRWLRGEDQVAVYEPEGDFSYRRCFCKLCGTCLGEPLSSDESFPVAAHCLDGDPGVRNRFHEFVADKPAWYEIGDDARQFPGHPRA